MPGVQPGCKSLWLLDGSELYGHSLDRQGEGNHSRWAGVLHVETFTVLMVPVGVETGLWLPRSSQVSMNKEQTGHISRKEEDGSYGQAQWLLA